LNLTGLTETIYKVGLMTKYAAVNPWKHLPRGLLVTPSLLACDFAHPADDIDQAIAGGVKVLHVDIMDGHFVPNLSMGPGFVEKIRRYTDCLLDVHLMVTDPEYFTESFAAAGADSITFHVEATKGPAALIGRIGELGMGCGICIKPATSPETIAEFVDAVDMVLVMTVEPGYGGQKFMADQLDKISRVREMLRSDQRLQVDGGIGGETAELCGQSGADVYVAGNSVFGSSDIGGAISDIVRSAQAGLTARETV